MKKEDEDKDPSAANLPAAAEPSDEAKPLLTTVSWSTVQGRPQWFKGPLRFSPFAPNNEFIHTFFDLEPMVDYLEKSVNFFVVNPSGSTTTMGFDVLSGKLYKKHDNCTSDDFWQGSANVPKATPYTEGIVPRILDQSGLPLKILVFGRESFYREYANDVSHQARVVGAMVEQYCETPPCEKGKGWESRMVLVAVDPFEDKYKSVRNLEELKKEVSWNEVMAFWQNADGVGYWLDKPYPAFRSIGNIAASAALKLTSTKTKVFTPLELNEIRKSCYKLYDILWNKIGDFKRVYSQIQKELDESHDEDPALQSLVGLTKTKEFKDELEASSKRMSLENYEKKLVRRIITFHQRYGRRFNTCTNFVYPSNILDNFHRHWFFAYYTLVYKLFDMGFVYDCWGGTWKRNVRMSTGSLEKKMDNALNGCSGRQVDGMFPMAVKFLAKLRETEKKYFRYVDYDNVPGGSHERIFSWITERGVTPLCQIGAKKGKADKAEKRDQENLFPEDTPWETLLLEGSEQKIKGKSKSSPIY